jgi:hypothetical protein
MLTDFLPTIVFLVVFPVFLRLIGYLIYRESGWQKLAVHYSTSDRSGRFETVFRLVVGGTKFGWSCRARQDADFLYLKPDFFVRLIYPGPPLKIPKHRIRMNGRKRGTISFPGGSVTFEGVDPRELPTDQRP